MNPEPDPLLVQLARLEPPPPPKGLLERCLSTIPESVDTSSPPTPGGRGSARILVVDDEPNIVLLLRTHLERQGFVVETAFNGAQALAMARHRRPDLLITDVLMPEMDGFELLAAIRQDPSLQDLPAIALTARANDRNVMQGYVQGADMYLTKPFNPQELLRFVERLLLATGS